jgi:hypothetical protein
MSFWSMAPPSPVSLAAAPGPLGVVVCALALKPAAQPNSAVATKRDIELRDIIRCSLFDELQARTAAKAGALAG